MAVNRRKFLNGMCLVAGSAIVLPHFLKKMGMDYFSDLSQENKKSYSAGVYLSPVVGRSLSNVYLQFIESLNFAFKDTHFYICSDSKKAQIKITSPSRGHQSERAMLFLTRAPGGLNKNDFKVWLNSLTAKNIWNSAYANKGYKPFYLFLGPEKYHQPVSLTFKEGNSKLLPFGSSIANSWRSAIREFRVVALPTPKVAQQKLLSGEILSTEALQPVVANSLKAQDELIFLEDGMSSTPALYHLLVADDFWNFLKPDQKNLLVNLVDQLSAKLDLHVASEEKKYDSNLFPADQMETLSPTILRMRQLEFNFSNELLRKHSHNLGMKKVYEEYESFRTEPSRKLILS